ncbi:MAG TPA: zf-HC2 domain-containing protein [Actinoplanes sp.]|jgi:predicted anti-sigma-YlaC factor YlaD
MACERWREMLSAQLDGEDDPADRALVEEHLAGCASCRQWLDRAATVNRLMRTGVATPAPELATAVLAAVPARTGRSRTALFLALAGVGAVQLILGLAQVGGSDIGEHVHGGLGATAGHLWHESAAWNVAVGAGYLFLALRRSRPTGLVPMLTAFVGMLLLLSINDLTAARVDGTRLVSHGFVILGYVLVVALSRVGGGGTAAPPGAWVGGGGGWRVRLPGDEGEVVAPPRLRLVPGQPGPLTAERLGKRAA